METNGNVVNDAGGTGKSKAGACLSAEAAPNIKGASSVEDLSEYTDADESVSSAPTEFLAEFLSAVMLKDYENALKYCKLILQYEPDNAAAKEFYPLIVEKIHLMEAEQDSSSSNSSISSSMGDDNGNKRKQPLGGSESDSDATTASYSSLEDEEADGNGNSTKLGMPIPVMVASTASGSTSGPAFQSTSSDSESPTEPISQQTIAQMRAKVVPTRSK